MCKRMIVVADGVLEKEVAKIRGSDQSDTVELKSRGTVLCKRKTCMGLQQRYEVQIFVFQ